MHAIAQGASERNISVVVDQKDATRALRAVHSGFYLSPHTISIGLIGPGAVGRVLLEQIEAERERLLRDFKLDLRVRGLMTSKKMLLSDRSAMPIDGWKAALDASKTPADIAKFAEHLHVDHLPHTVILDCTADESVAKHYADWLKARHPRRHAQQEGEQRAARVSTTPSRKRAASAAPRISTKRPWAPDCR